VKKIIEEREKLFLEMQKFDWLKVHPSQSNYFLFETKHWAELFKYLLERGIIVRQMNNGRRLQEALRVTVGSPEENKVFVEALRGFPALPTNPKECL
jgi:histidinol-phosphate aminotransferase